MRNSRFWLLALGFGITSCVFYCSLVAYKAHRKRQEVIQWLKRVPQTAEHAQTLGVIPYDTYDDWVHSARQIDGLEKTLVQLLEDPSSEVLRPNEELATWDVAHALCYVGSSRSVPVLIRVMQDKQRSIPTREFSASALGHIGDPRAFGPLCRIVKSSEEQTSLRMNALLGLSVLGDPNAIPVIEGVLDAPEFTRSNRWHASKMLEELREKNSQEEE